jgi:hypothetical protein
MNELILILNDLKVDTANWNKEKNKYKKSIIYKFRHYYSGFYKRS